MGQLVTPEPLINGRQYDFSSMEAQIVGQGGSLLLSKIKAVNYKEKRSPGYIRGTHANRIGKTLGTYDAEGSLEVYQPYFDDLCRFLTLGGLGYLEQEFNLVLNFAARGMPITTHVLEGINLLEPDQSNQEGPDALLAKCSFDLVRINRNGLYALSSLAPGAGL